MVYLFILEGKTLKIIRKESMKGSYNIEGCTYFTRGKPGFYIAGEAVYMFYKDNPIPIVLALEEEKEKLKKAKIVYYNKQYEFDSELAYSMLNSERLKRIYSYKTSVITITAWVILFSIIAFLLGLVLEFKFNILG